MQAADPTPSRDELVADARARYADLKRIHESALEEYGVALPELERKTADGSTVFAGGALQLIYLFKNKGRQVSREDISDYVRSIEPGLKKDQQARHLADKGWDVKKSGKAKGKFMGAPVKPGHHVLASVDAPAPEFMLKRLKRLGRAAAKDWDALQAAYEHRCACCGKLRQGKLEKGHKNPHKSSAIENLIPTCGECNNWAGDKFVFDDAGRVTALASPAIVLASEEQVQLSVYQALKKLFGKR